MSQYEIGTSLAWYHSGTSQSGIGTILATSHKRTYQNRTPHNETYHNENTIYTTNTKGVNNDHLTLFLRGKYTNIVYI